MPRSSVYQTLCGSHLRDSTNLLRNRPTRVSWQSFVESAAEHHVPRILLRVLRAIIDRTDRQCVGRVLPHSDLTRDDSVCPAIAAWKRPDYAGQRPDGQTTGSAEDSERSVAPEA